MTLSYQEIERIYQIALQQLKAEQAVKKLTH